MDSVETAQAQAAPTKYRVAEAGRRRAPLVLRLPANRGFIISRH